MRPLICKSHMNSYMEYTDSPHVNKVKKCQRPNNKLIAGCDTEQLSGHSLASNQAAWKQIIHSNSLKISICSHSPWGREHCCQLGPLYPLSLILKSYPMLSNWHLWGSQGHWTKQRTNLAILTKNNNILLGTFSFFIICLFINAIFVLSWDFFLDIVTPTKHIHK